MKHPEISAGFVGKTAKNAKTPPLLRGGAFSRQQEEGSLTDSR